MALAAGQMGGGDLEPSADSAETRRLKGVSNLCERICGAGGGDRTLTGLLPGDFKSVNFLYRPQPWTCLAILNITENIDSRPLHPFSICGGQC